MPTPDGIQSREQCSGDFWGRKGGRGNGNGSVAPSQVNRNGACVGLALRTSRQGVQPAMTHPCVENDPAGLH